MLSLSVDWGSGGSVPRRQKNTGEVSNVFFLRHLGCLYIQKIILLSKHAKGHILDDNKSNLPKLLTMMMITINNEKSVQQEKRVWWYLAVASTV